MAGVREDKVIRWESGTCCPAIREVEGEIVLSVMENRCMDRRIVELVKIGNRLVVQFARGQKVDLRFSALQMVLVIGLAAVRTH